MLVFLLIIILTLSLTGCVGKVVLSSKIDPLDGVGQNILSNPKSITDNTDFKRVMQTIDSKEVITYKKEVEFYNHKADFTFYLKENKQPDHFSYSVHLSTYDLSDFEITVMINTLISSVTEELVAEFGQPASTYRIGIFKETDNDENSVLMDSWNELKGDVCPRIFASVSKQSGYFSLSFDKDLT